MVFFLGEDKYKFGEKIRKLTEDNEEGTDKFPKTICSAYYLLVKA